MLKTVPKVITFQCQSEIKKIQGVEQNFNPITIYSGFLVIVVEN